MKKYLFTLIVFALICNACTHLNGATNNLSPEGFIDQFFEKLSENQSSEAIDLMFSSNEWFTEDDIKSIKDQFTSQTSQMGSFIDKKLITTKTTGEDFILYSYFVKYEAQPLRINFIYYRPNKDWMIYNFNYDFSIDEELLEAASAHRLKENLIY